MSIIKSLIKTEEQRDLYRRLKKISGKLGENMSTTSVEVKNNDGSCTKIVSKKKMERAIIEENIVKYHQTEQSCPFLHDPLRSQFGEFGEGPAMEEVRAGKCVNDHDNCSVREFIKVFSTKTPTTQMERMLRNNLEM